MAAGGMSPGQIRKNWHSSARAWFRAAEKYAMKRDRQFAEREGWHSLLRAVSGL